MAKYFVEEVFVTEGVPEYTFVKPPNYNEILVDIRRAGKPVIIEGQSGSGKTCAARKILEQLSDRLKYEYLSARHGPDVEKIIRIANTVSLPFDLGGIPGWPSKSWMTEVWRV